MTRSRQQVIAMWQALLCEGIIEHSKREEGDREREGEREGDRERRETERGREREREGGEEINVK